MYRYLQTLSRRFQYYFWNIAKQMCKHDDQILSFFRVREADFIVLFSDFRRRIILNNRYKTDFYIFFIQVGEIIKKGLDLFCFHSTLCKCSVIQVC